LAMEFATESARAKTIPMTSITRRKVKARSTATKCEVGKASWMVEPSSPCRFSSVRARVAR